MPQSRISYHTESLFAGPSPSTGFHFMSYVGTLNNNHVDLVKNHNLLHEINRVQNISFSFNPGRTDIKQLGRRQLVDYPNVNPPNIKLDFEYFLNGVVNDARLGLNVNYAQYHYPNTGGTPYYADNFTVNLLSGLMGRQLTQPTSDPFFPLVCRDNRNIFLVRTWDTDQQLRKRGKEKVTEPDLTRIGADSESTGYQIFAFGNCYLENYRTRGAVNDFPTSSVSFSCENAAFYLSGSGCNIPAINTQTRQIVNSNKFVIPITYNEGGPYTLHPGDMILDITSSGDSLSGLGVDFNNIFITNYQIDMNLNREPLSSIGYKCPLDRQINFPVFVDLNFGMTVGDTTSGSLIDLLNIDSGYNIILRLRNPECAPFTTETGNPRQSGPVFSGSRHTAIRYDFRDARFIGMNYNTAIGTNKSANLSFRTEVNPDEPSKGFYISGLLNIEKLEDFLLDEDGFPLFDHASGPIVTNLVPLF